MFYQTTNTDTSNNHPLGVRLVGSIGLPKHHAYASTADMTSTKFPIPLLAAARENTVDTDRGVYFDDVDWQGFGEPSNVISIIPLRNGQTHLGFLIIGTNPRRPTDADHHQLTADLARNVSLTITSVLDAKEAMQRQERLEKELAFSERQLRYLSEHASVAMSSFDLAGNLLWANDHYYNIMGYEKSKENDAKSFIEYIHVDSHEETASLFAGLSVENARVSLEIKLNRLYTPPVGPPEAAHALAWGFPYFEDGKPTTLMSVMTDVSHLRWQERWQARIAEEAREAKSNQDQFIDCISHEIRNPMSAIFQLADAISSPVAELNNEGLTLQQARELLEDNAQFAETILLCAKHQKRIVDDVLTISRLDFMLLSFAPVPASPTAMVKDAIKMFQFDAITQAITFNVEENTSLEACTANWVLFDPSRVSQIFINIITNAIKFTKAEKSDKTINIAYGACLEDPRSQFPSNMMWAPKSNPEHEPQNLNMLPCNAGEGVLYLTFSITDTGAGMTDEEVHKVFSRFSQASATTFLKHGGSGLGLYICQRLLEKQGGDIGVISAPGNGSNFGFYIQCMRVKQPDRKPNPKILESPTIEVPSLAITKLAINGHSLFVPNSQPELKTPPPPTIHVLLVEDNLVNQHVLRKQLIRQGCEVTVANHGVEALEELKRTKCWHDTPGDATDFDVILMDWEMPIMDGLTCSKEIRKLEAEGKIRSAYGGGIDIIAVTANTRKEQIEQALRAGINDVLPKPFMVPELMSMLRGRISKRTDT